MESRPAVQLITEELIGRVAAEAHRSPRLRKNYNFHSGDQDNPHRFLNVLLRGAYVRPHRHLAPPKPESFLVLKGHAAVFLFDSSGAVSSAHLLGPGTFQGTLPSKVRDRTPALGIDLAPGLWHTIAALTPVAVCYEVKPGPWDPATDKEFAPWAPEEGSPAAAAYLAELLSERAGGG